MMSLLALTGFALGGVGDASSDEHESLPENEFLFEQEQAAQQMVPVDALDAEFELTPAETVELARGDAISDFNPRLDTLELEYTAALGIPDVTVTDFADGTGASIALNGVVVADVAGAQGLDASAVNLIAI